MGRRIWAAVSPIRRRVRTYTYTAGKSAGRPYAGPAGGGAYGAVIHMNGARVAYDNGVGLRIAHIYFNFSGTKADPDKISTSTNKPFDASNLNCDLYIFNCYFRMRESSTFWIYFADIGGLIKLHDFHLRIPGELGDTGESVIVFDLYSSVASRPSANYGGRGWCHMTISRDLEIRNTRTRTDPDVNGRRKILYKIDQRGHYDRPTRFHAIKDGLFTISNQDDRDTRFIGCDIDFDCNLNTNSFVYAGHHGHQFF